MVHFITARDKNEPKKSVFILSKAKSNHELSQLSIVQLARKITTKNSAMKLQDEMNSEQKYK